MILGATYRAHGGPNKGLWAKLSAVDGGRVVAHTLNFDGSLGTRFLASKANWERNWSPADIGRWELSFMVPVKTVAKLNRRGHWSALAAKDKKERDAAVYSWRAAGGRISPPFPCQVTFTRLSPRVLDEGDNLESAFKCIRDALFRDWSLKSDNGPEVKWVSRQEKVTGGGGYVRVDIVAIVERR